ncbi:hypothetical protein FB451DRAFT_1395545 [Mycena latifolia]|nr:hypothetical protein FB451DRAFT_1395545 [Mycena latifolia]
MDAHLNTDDDFEHLPSPTPPVQCERCNAEGEFTCSDCAADGHADLQCRACIIANHRMASRLILEPLHQIQRWNGHYLEHSDLRQLGLRIQLGHDSLEECAVPGTTSFLNVITHRGVQVLCIVYCACNQAPSRQTQLIDAGLIPTGEPLWAITSNMEAHLATW